MAQEEKTNIEQGTNVNPTEQDALELLRKQKESSVPKEDYEKLRADNKRLMENFLNGGGEQKEKEPELRSAKDIYAEMYNGKDKTNLEFIKLACEYRDSYKKETGIDCFVASSHDITPTQSDYEQAENIYKTYKECIEKANGDPQRFTAELQLRMQDVNVPRFNY